MFGQIPPTQFDLRFSLFRIPARVHPGFWLLVGFLGYNLLKQGPEYFFTFVAAVFFSLIVHEYGHALMAKRYGYDPTVILYWFGGLATFIPDSRMTPARSIVISVMGPVPQLALYGITYGTRYLLMQNGTFFEMHPVAQSAFLFLEWINLIWALFNLIPILPMDGGQILQAALMHFRVRNAQVIALKTSILVACGLGLCLLFFREKIGVTAMPGIVLLMFAFMNFQTLQHYQRGGY